MAIFDKGKDTFSEETCYLLEKDKGIFSKGNAIFIKEKEIFGRGTGTNPVTQANSKKRGFLFLQPVDPKADKVRLIIT